MESVWRLGHSQDASERGQWGASKRFQEEEGYSLISIFNSWLQDYRGAGVGDTYGRQVQEAPSESTDSGRGGKRREQIRGMCQCVSGVTLRILAGLGATLYAGCPAIIYRTPHSH